MTSPKKQSYMIGSGWWCDEQPGVLPHHKGIGYIRSQDFHKIWYQLINKFTHPERILIVDSASPIPPPINLDDKRIEVHCLAKNLLHATVCKDQFCGWTASVMTGLLDCMFSDIEYFVYVEQDVLLYGEGIIEKAIASMTTPYMFGEARGIPQPLQQSLFIIHRSGIPSFMHNMLAMREPDRVLSPERKFHFACLGSAVSNKMVRWLLRRWRNYDFLPYGYGRKRPLDFSQSHFYFQHATEEEFEQFQQQYKSVVEGDRSK